MTALITFDGDAPTIVNNTFPSQRFVPRRRRLDSLGRELGRGSFSTVCEYTLVTGETQAAKVYHMDVPSDDCHPIRREAFILRTLQGEKGFAPHIVKCYGVEVVVDQGEEVVLLKLERIEGSSLEKILEQKMLGDFSFFEIMDKVCIALDYTKSRKIAHNDLKPSNIMVTKNGEVRLIDWGLAHPAYRNSWSSKGTFAGTLQYMSPEQAQGKQTGPPTDWFACGAILYEGLTGNLIHGEQKSPGATLQSAASFSDKRWRLAAEEIRDLGYEELVRPFKHVTNPVERYRKLEPLAEYLSQYRELSRLSTL